ncbi:hypothetical protein PQB35_gp60 [Ochrobactrum phage vB_OspP_OH]|uniref:Uncharacterized protein n=1 Tax=Ochrobactrum phage vB_OspP_OH TaxID=2712957 RepID=A0A6G6XXM5_9CAUD|nr:hypothetical protein PQB35_gp60 [Ochrobactrum phage vB_OspP_OH]QIG66116.1 hypothetical protein phiOH_p60 [Ochrobactrum phage vB_OspP_OH]
MTAVWPACYHTRRPHSYLRGYRSACSTQ